MASEQQHVDLPLCERDGQVRLELRVKPRASRSKILGVRAGALEVAVTAPPVDGAANEEVVDVLARALGVPRRDVEIVIGATGRNKVIAVKGLCVDDVRDRLALLARKEHP